ncbi:MAG: methionine--tRNA ligase subunit beta [Candidatus Bathyarchaeia archaeon]|jgi:methionyl-tRNA synthetase
MSESEIVSIREFKRLDIRTGTVKGIEQITGSDKLYKLQVDMGDHTRQIVTGLVEYYKPEEIKDKVICVICNLKPAKIFGSDSNGMLLTAEKDGKLSLLTTEREVPNGSKIS